MGSRRLYTMFSYGLYILCLYEPCVIVAVWAFDGYQYTVGWIPVSCVMHKRVLSARAVAVWAIVGINLLSSDVYVIWFNVWHGIVPFYVWTE